LILYPEYTLLGCFCFQRHVHLYLMPGKRIAVSMVCALLAARDVMGDRSGPHEKNITSYEQRLSINYSCFVLDPGIM
jgi:hypothetical protein